MFAKFKRFTDYKTTSILTVCALILPVFSNGQFFGFYMQMILYADKTTKF